MACPYFFPTEKSNDIFWPFPRRLPLGAGFCGLCTANNTRSTPTQAELKEFCNLGYAKHCEKIPADRGADSVRFSVVHANKPGKNCIRLHYSLEKNHAPVQQGVLEYDCETRSWFAEHKNTCIQRQAQCYVEMYLNRVIGSPDSIEVIIKS
ncbi:MAG TPA: hypothetical protein VHA33_25075 [Candidatus Angelobacter sp.]|nr:hypothetical protein [Candidatus Angelobacter sp.]